MLYHVIHIKTNELKAIATNDVLDMDYDADGRVIIITKDNQNYFLIASKDIVND